MLEKFKSKHENISCNADINLCTFAQFQVPAPNITYCLISIKIGIKTAINKVSEVLNVRICCFLNNDS